MSISNFVERNTLNVVNPDSPRNGVSHTGANMADKFANFVLGWGRRVEIISTELIPGQENKQIFAAEQKDTRSPMRRVAEAVVRFVACLTIVLPLIALAIKANRESLSSRLREFTPDTEGSSTVDQVERELAAESALRREAQALSPMIVAAREFGDEESGESEDEAVISLTHTTSGNLRSPVNTHERLDAMAAAAFQNTPADQSIPDEVVTAINTAGRIDERMMTPPATAEDESDDESIAWSDSNNPFAALTVEE